MKSLRKSIFNLLFLLMPNMTFAGTPLFLNDIEVVEASSLPDLQSLVNQSFREIFDSEFGKNLCSLTHNPALLRYSTGISLETAEEIFQACGTQRISRALENAKIWPKKYYFVLNSNQSSPVESWTSHKNETFIWLGLLRDENHLKEILLHELAMTFDAKSNLLYTQYLLYQKIASEPANSKGDVVVYMSKKTSAEELISNALNASLYRPISLAFLTLRAFQVEKYVSDSQSIGIYRSHEQCRREFHVAFEATQKMEISFDSHSKADFQSYLAQVVSDQHKPTDTSQTLNFIMSENLRMPHDRRVTFCQYMSQPLLTGKSTFSFFAHGPRPSLTGGWEEFKDKEAIKKVETPSLPQHIGRKSEISPKILRIQDEIRSGSVETLKIKREKP